MGERLNKYVVQDLYYKCMTLIQRNIDLNKIKDENLLDYATADEKEIIKYSMLFNWWGISSIVDSKGAYHIKYEFDHLKDYETETLKELDVIAKCLYRFLEKNYNHLLDKYPGNTYLLLATIEEMKEKCCDSLYTKVKHFKRISDDKKKFIKSLLINYNSEISFKNIVEIELDKLFKILKSDNTNIYCFNEMLKTFIFYYKTRPASYAIKAIPFYIVYLIHLASIIIGAILIILQWCGESDLDFGYFLFFMGLLFAFMWYNLYEQVRLDGHITIGNLNHVH